MSAPTPATHDPSTSSADRRVLLWLVAIGFFMQTLDATIINTALPAMAASLGESPLRMQSVIVAYSLTMAMLIPASGWLADRFGTRRVFMLAIALFSLGSLACAGSRGLGELVAARVLQGLGGALLLPVGRLSVLRTFPRGEFLQAMSFVAIPGLIGPLLGPTLGGWLVQYASWHWIFLINLPVGLIGLVATQRFMPDARAEQTRRFDLWGYALLAFGMVAISLAIEGGSGLGMRQAGSLVLGVFGFAALVVYWLHAVRHPQPLFSTQLFRVRTLSVGLLGNLFCRLGSGAMPFLIPISLQISLGYSPLQAGLMMLPTALAGMAMKRVATPLILRFGYRNVLVGNTAIIGLLMASFALATPGEPIWLRVLQLAAFGAFNSLQFTAMNTITLKDLDGASASSGNSLLSMVQMLAMSLGVAVAGAVLSGFSAAFGGTGTPGAALEAFQATFVTVGLITLASAAVFWQLPAEARAPQLDGPEVSGHG
ncbi:MAG: multidrug transporter subunit MdtD [Rhodocyclaceae bacterium]|nr:multidrug transporter subunit MdtD [Pseudomonadota bacterium]MDQ7973320.1 multidrug transporter subunit MdtD [Rhodocyclaceae bacterium]MDQ8002087.1 multidrug transporter subunit MdtD [Pseudomonadota bacterium]MDQ8016206.1 multidrug transporter subunit MdtD [Pseudomonadota bacterium]